MNSWENPFAIATKKIKYLGINWKKQVQILSEESFKIHTPKRQKSTLEQMQRHPVLVDRLSRHHKELSSS